MIEKNLPQEIADSSDDYFIHKILRRDKYPELPAELPTQVELSPEVIGDLEKIILESHTDGMERSQLTKIGNGGVVANEVVLGNNEEIGKKSRALATLQSFFKRNGLVFSHTHPEFKESFDFGRFSSLDVAYFSMRTKLAHIFLVGHISGVRALIQTKESRKLPFYAAEKAFQVLDKLKDAEFEDMDVPLEKIASALEELGYGLYEWSPTTSIVEAGCMSTGIVLKKISSSN